MFELGIYFPMSVVYLLNGYIILQVAESKLAKFVEDIIVPPRMIDIIVDEEVLLAPWFVCSSYLFLHCSLQLFQEE